MLFPWDDPLPPGALGPRSPGAQRSLSVAERERTADSSPKRAAAQVQEADQEEWPLCPAHKRQPWQDGGHERHFSLLPVTCMACFFCAAMACVGCYQAWRWFHRDPDLPHELFCANRQAGHEFAGEGVSSRLPEGPRTLMARFQTTTPGQSIVFWGEDLRQACADLALSKTGWLEYTERPGHNMSEAVLRDETKVHVTDGFWHSAVVVRDTSGLARLFVDGFNAGVAQMPTGSWQGCGAVHEDAVFEGSMESFRIFDLALSQKQANEIIRYPCETTTATTTSTTRTETSTATTTTTTRTRTTREAPIIAPSPTPAPLDTTTATSTTTKAPTTWTVTSTSTTPTTETHTRTTTTTTRSSTETSTTTATLAGAKLPAPIYSSIGKTRRPDPGTVISFEGAGLPTGNKSFTVMLLVSDVSMSTPVQEVISWGTPDRANGCVSIVLSTEDGLRYGELPAPTDAQPSPEWQWISSGSSFNLGDGQEHSVAVARDLVGIAYLYVDNQLVAQDVYEAERPGTQLPNKARTGGSCGEEGPEPFQGAVAGLRIFDAPLNGELLAAAQIPRSAKAL